MRDRAQQFVAGSVTDQALLGAVFFGTLAHLQQSPADWKQDWGGLGYRVGSRYAQNMAKGLAEFSSSTIMRSDPRHVSYASDPRIKRQACGAGGASCSPKISARIGHAFLDCFTVRRSSVDGNGRRLPNIPLFAGAAASGFVGNAWYPDRLATPGQAGIRASYSIGTALGASFYSEFQPEIGRLLGAIFSRGKTPRATPGGTK